MRNTALATLEGTGIGDMLARWRKLRRLSQLDLALAAGISAKHLSFLETGRSRPSREMVLALATTLDVPLRQQNALLLAAGFAPAWRESDLAAPELAQVNHALDYMLAQQEPFPALVVDRRWNLLRANAGAVSLTAFLLGAAPEGPVNLAEAMLSPDALRPYIVDWEAAALYLIRGVQADATADGTAETAALLQRLLAFPDVPRLSRVLPLERMPEPVLIVEFRKSATSLRLFTTIATLGTPHDVTLQEIRIECFFPADAATRRIFQDWAMAEK
jgi:transcriptional regulator with XRE-family HTH domain